MGYPKVLDDSYQSVSDSVALICKWLHFQFGDDADNFVAGLFQIITMQYAHKNVFWLYGEAGCGIKSIVESVKRLFGSEYCYYRFVPGARFRFHSVFTFNFILK